MSVVRVGHTQRLSTRAAGDGRERVLRAHDASARNGAPTVRSRRQRHAQAGVGERNDRQTDASIASGERVALQHDAGDASNHGRAAGAAAGGAADAAGLAVAQASCRPPSV